MRWTPTTWWPWYLFVCHRVVCHYSCGVFGETADRTGEESLRISSRFWFQIWRTPLQVWRHQLASRCFLRELNLVKHIQHTIAIDRHETKIACCVLCRYCMAKISPTNRLDAPLLPQTANVRNVCVATFVRCSFAYPLIQYELIQFD